MNNIRLLPNTLINQIAAGEVVERPASALKELAENAIDAGATQIDITVIDGGKTYFSVTDNGRGMTRDELALAVDRHATSKLPTDDLHNINFLGFRGEALPSIASVSKLKITSRPNPTHRHPEALAEGSGQEQSEAYSISVNAGKKENPVPAPHAPGTTVEVRDLFFATPARLKFLKAPPTELMYIKDIVYRLAMSYPSISFSLSDGNRTLLKYPATDSLFDRVSLIIGKEFKPNAVVIDTEHDGITLRGFVGLPTYLRSTSSDQYLFVNGRSVKDKVLTGAIRGAFQGLIGHNGHPVLALFIHVPNQDIDVNVHPAKTEVRFRDAGAVRGLLVGSIRAALAEHGHKTSTTVGIGTLGKSTPYIMPGVPTLRHAAENLFKGKTQAERLAMFQKNSVNVTNLSKFRDALQEAFSQTTTDTPDHQPTLSMRDAYSVKTVSDTPVIAGEAKQSLNDSTTNFPPLGLAKAQLHETYIISQRPDSIIVTDQHAAHERLTYEKLIAQYKHPQTQLLLIPEIVDLKPEYVDLLTARADELKSFGLAIDSFGPDSVAVREIPALLDKADIKKLIQDLADTLREFDDTVLLKDKIKDIVARLSCHGSIRAGRKLTADEMNALLRAMENCSLSGQCIHGRPTYVELKLSDIERLFGRKK